MNFETEYKFRLHPRAKSLSPNSLQFLISMFGLASATVLTIHGHFCKANQSIFVTSVLFVSLAWMAMLLLTWVDIFRTDIFSKILLGIDYLFLGGFILLWLWLGILSIKGDFFGCHKMLNVFGVCFLVSGLLEIVLIVLTLLLLQSRKNPAVDEKGYRAFDMDTGRDS